MSLLGELRALTLKGFAHRSADALDKMELPAHPVAPSVRRALDDTLLALEEDSQVRADRKSVV